MNINVDTVLKLEEWIAAVMVFISFCFVAYDVITQGVPFTGSVLPLAVMLISGLLYERARRRLLRTVAA